MNKLLILFIVGAIVGAAYFGYSAGDKEVVYYAVPTIETVYETEYEIIYVVEENQCSYNDVVDFLATDNTKAYYKSNEDSLDCLHLSIHMRDNAKAKRLKCGIAIMRNEEIGTGEVAGSHAIVVFDTFDRGYVFIEPAYGLIVPTPAIGMVYSKELDEVAKNHGFRVIIGLQCIREVIFIW